MKRANNPAAIARKREQQIRAQIRDAVKLLDGRGRDEVARAILTIEDKNSVYELAKVHQSKKHKLALRGLLSALRRARKWQDTLPLDFQELFVDLKEYEEGCARLLATAPVARPKRDDFKQRLAVREAHDLLLRYGYKASKTRKGKYHQLAAILYGDPSANLYHYLN